MKNSVRKIKYCLVAAGITLSMGITSNALAQSTPDAWTGAIPGDTFMFNSSSGILADVKNYLNQGEVDRAVNMAKRYAASFERDTRSGKTSSLRYDAYNALCISLAAKKSYTEAKEACDTAIKDTPGRWMAYNSRGNLNMKMGNSTEAINDYNMALNNAPASSELRSILQHNIQLSQGNR